MNALRYTVKKGDTLWDIAGHHYGDPTQWPKLYRYNNRPEIVQLTGRRIVDEDLIYPGQILYLPPKEGAGAGALPSLPRPSTPPKSAAPATKPPVALPPSFPKQVTNSSGAQKTKSTDTWVDNFAFSYSLDDIPLSVIVGPGFKATLKLSGSLRVQRTNKIPLVTFSNKSAEILARQQANTILGTLISDQKIKYDYKSKTVGFENTLTIKANAQSPATELTAGFSMAGKPVLKAAIVYPPLQGAIQDYLFTVFGFKVVVEIEEERDMRLSPQPIPQPAYVPAPAPAPSSYREAPQEEQGMGKALGAALVVGGVIVIGATLIEDIFTAGAGVADDPVSLAGAGAMITRGAAAFGF